MLRVTDQYSISDELRLPFIYVPYGQPESPDVAAFKARYPGWFSIPATFTPYPEPPRHDVADPPLEAIQAMESSERPGLAPPPRRIGGIDTTAALRAFQRAMTQHGDPVAALRALKDTPDVFAAQSVLPVQAEQPPGSLGHHDIHLTANGVAKQRPPEQLVCQSSERPDEALWS